MDPSWSQEAQMPVNLSVKNVPDTLAERLRQRARRNHRSLQGEMVAILEAAAEPERISPSEALLRGRELNIRVKGGSTRLLRAIRDAR
jgi:plasmid stability protein